MGLAPGHRGMDKVCKYITEARKIDFDEDGEWLEVKTDRSREIRMKQSRKGGLYVKA